MTNKSISQLSAGGAVAGTDLFPDVQTVGVGPVKVTAEQIKTFMTTSPSFTGSLTLNGSTSGAVTLGVPAAAGTTTFTLPGSNGSANYALTTNGSGVTSWSQISLTAGITGTLPVTNGGTGTSTAFTAGSIVFAGASGVYSQNNTKLFWDNTNSRLGIGFGAPAYTFDIIGADLGATAGNTSLLGRYFSQTGDGESLQILYSRTASSPTNWTTASLILRREVSGAIQQALQFNGDASTTINHGTNELFRVNSNGNVGIATPSPSYPLDVAGTVRGTTALVGNLAALGGYGYTPALQVLGSTISAASLLMQATASGAFPILTFGNATSSNSGALSSGDTVGTMRFYGGDGTNPIRAAAIAAVVDGAVSTGSMPGRLVFQTTPSGSSTPTERMRITSAGNVLVGTTSPPTTGTQCLTIGTGIAPTATPADTVTLYSSDLSAGNTIPSIYTEGTGIVSANAGTTNLSNRIAVRINGTVYYLLAASSA